MNDISFQEFPIFITAGQDGFVRQFDIRCKDNNVLFQGGVSVLKLAVSDQITAIILNDCNHVCLIDKRMPAVPLGFLPHQD